MSIKMLKMAQIFEQHRRTDGRRFCRLNRRGVGAGYVDLVFSTITRGTSSTTVLPDSTVAARFKVYGSEVQVLAAE